MPITGPSSYVSTTQQFLTHWEETTGALPPDEPIILSGNTTTAAFSTLREQLLTQRGNLEAADLDVVEARAALSIAKEALLAQLNLFNGKVRGAMGTSVYARMLPKVPGIGDGQEGFSKPLAQAERLWTKINSNPPPGVTAPVVLVDETDQTAFAASVAALADLYDSLVDAEQNFTLMMETRNATQDALYALMKEYRLMVPTRFLPGAALLESLPALTPVGGRTPDPVSLSGGWNVEDAAALLTAGVSDDPDLKDYELRWCAGADYSTDTEHVAGSVPAGTPPVFVTAKGLVSSGSVASFRVYVQLKNGHEAGSDTVVVSRP